MTLSISGPRASLETSHRPSVEAAHGSSLDVLTLGTVWNRLNSIVDEQSARVIRAGMTTSLSEGGDISCGLFDEAGRLLVQSTGTPGMSHSLPEAIRAFKEIYPPQRLAPGDALITNDPWLCAGHLNDIVIATPIFRDGHLVGFSASACHAADIGGRGFAPNAADVYEEGLQLPRMRLMRRGRTNHDLIAIIRANVRIPDAVVADVMSQARSSQIAGEQVGDLLDEFQLASLIPVGDAIVATSANAMSQAIEAIPDGLYRDELWTDGLDRPLHIVASVTVAQRRLGISFAGTSDQVASGLNSVENYSRAYAVHAVKAALLPDVPNNQGVFDSVETYFPLGSVLNPRRPAPVSARHLVGHFAGFAVLGALQHAAPHLVIADSAGPCGGTLQFNGQYPDGSPLAVLAFCAGGLGARPEVDGLDTTPFPANSSNTSVEILEQIAPITVLSKEFIPDSGGAGRFRGGLGQRIAYRIEADAGLNVTFMLERVRHAARGFGGGLPGAATSCRVNGHAIDREKGIHTLAKGDVVELSLAGGGGFHSPESRDPSQVVKDVAAGKVSRQSALETYLVALDHELSYDSAATARLRAAND